MKDRQPDSSELAQTNTILAYSRTRAASERTLMAWIRTSLAMISFGFSISTFFRSLGKLNALPALQFADEPMILGLVLVFLGTAVLVVGAAQEYLHMKEMHRLMAPLRARGPWTFTMSFAALMTVVGAVVFAYMVYKSLH
jgi:uncharacterized membrane protein YidH (DUF202 family)